MLLLPFLFQTQEALFGTWRLDSASGPSAYSRVICKIEPWQDGLRVIYDMDQECRSSAARYGIVLDASLITGIDPPPEVESALAAINTAYNQVSSDISLAQAAADQKIVQSKRAVEIETLKAQAEVEPLNSLAAQLTELKKTGSGALQAYVRNVRLTLFAQAQQAFLETKK